MSPPKTAVPTSGARHRPGIQETNKLRAEDSAVHRWYRFVLSFPPHLVRDYLERFDIRSGQTVLDPFCGTGTTLVECKKLGINSLGVERNPLAAFASSVKVDWEIDSARLLASAAQVAHNAESVLAAQGIKEWSDLPLFGENGHPSADLLALPAEAASLLLKNSISPLPLHRTLVLLDAIQRISTAGFQRHQILALAKTLVSGISNIEFGPEVGVGPAKADAPVLTLWTNAVKEITQDLRLLASGANATAAVQEGDAREIASIIPTHTVDAVITSPPYPNEKDYTRTTRLELVLLGFIKNKADLRALKQGMVRSNTRGVYRDDEDHLLVADNSEVQEIADAIERRRLELGKTSGFERMYPRVTKLYFGGMTRHLAELRKVLRPGAKLAYVVGDQASYLRVMIRTGSILADIAKSLGYEVLSIDLFRTRLATATKEQLREEVVALRWPG